MMYGYIYLTTNLINNKKYIGQHKYNRNEIDPYYFGSGILLAEAMKKYGKENFKSEILDICNSIDELNEKEIYWIQKLNAVDDENYYNISSGGNTAHDYNNCTDITKQKLSKIQANHRTIHNDSCQLVIDKNDLDSYLQKGYKLGRLPKDYSVKAKKYSEYRQNLSDEEKANYYSKISKTILGRKWVHNETNEKQVDVSELPELLNSGWVLGRLYAKGKYKV